MARSNLSAKRILSDNSGLAEAQGAIILIVIVILAGIIAKSTIGDTMISAALDFGKFRVWGDKNDISTLSAGIPFINITSPSDGMAYYSDQGLNISGNIIPDPGRNITLVYYRISDGEWKIGKINNSLWSGERLKFLAGDHKIEAIAFDDAGESSQPAFSLFRIILRLLPDALYIWDDIPPVMTANDTYDISIKYANTGMLPWNGTSGYMLSPSGIEKFSSGDIPVGISEEILPSMNRTFKTTIKAPSAAGIYNMSYMMRCSDFGWFGQQFSRNITVLESIYDAMPVSIEMPSYMYPSSTATVSITMKNTGTSAWYENSAKPVKLGIVGGKTGDAYYFNNTDTSIKMSPNSIIRSGNTTKFVFNIRAPGLGTYNLRYRMLLGNSTWFGIEANKTILVALSPPSPTPVPPGPTTEPYVSYSATGTMTLVEHTGKMYTGCIPYYYDGPLCNHYSRASYYDIWDIGGPNGHYKVYNEAYYGQFEFDMNNGGSKGTISFIRK
jgi:hypothetical protein